MKPLLHALAMTAALGIGAGPVLADPPGSEAWKKQFEAEKKYREKRFEEEKRHYEKGYDGYDRYSSPDVHINADIRFGSDEARLIRDYFGSHRYTPEPLPPGIAKNLARGKPLPPGIAKRSLPGDLSGRLPYYDGYDRVMVGRDVLLIEAATGIVVDILSDAF